MKSLRSSRLILLGLVAAGSIAACGSPDGKGDGEGSGATSGDGDGDTGGTGIGDGDGDLEVGTGGMVGDGDGDLTDPDLVDCSTAADCCVEADGCTDPNSFICTTDGYCGLIKGPCEDHGDCQGDTYCCEGELCRNDGSSEGVCISAAIPPGLDCGLSLAVGEFAPDVQCEWLKPAPGEPEPTSFHVLATPLVVDLPYDSGAAAEIIIVTTKSASTPDATAPGVIRILNGQDCTLHDSIVLPGAVQVTALAAPAIGDVDGDGVPEIAARGEQAGDAHDLVLLAWNGTTYAQSWTAPTTVNIVDEAQRSQHPWAGPSLHDLDDDGVSEILLEQEVWAADGTPLFAISPAQFQSVWNGYIPVVADVDVDGTPELIATRSGQITISDWNSTTNEWTLSGNLGGSGAHFAVADFGTQTGNAFDPKVLDGIAEIVAVEPFNGDVTIRTITGLEVMTAATDDTLDGGGSGNGDKGGPPVVGDFDADGFPEVGVAGETRVRVFDLDCPIGCNGSGEDFVRWSRSAQDSTSGQTGGTIFDFDGDGQAEMVYADECFLRVYNGSTGEVLFSSYRTSTTWLESPLVADIDRDENTELVVNSNDFNTACPTSSAGGPFVDPIHPGVKCSSDDSCPSGSTCGGDGLCTGCTTDADCCDTASLELCGLTCADRVDTDPGTGKVCRATHPGATAEVTGVRVLRDRLDRWASSRSIWNQHAYSVTNVMTDGAIPQTSAWGPNWVEDDLNNYRANVQGVAGFDDLPDITGRLAAGETCIDYGDGIALRSTVCNRGKRAVGAELPATFYIGDPADGNVLCTSYTDQPVPTGGCLEVECTLNLSVAGEDITVVVNDDGTGRPKTVECRDNNNTDIVNIDKCIVPR